MAKKKSRQQRKKREKDEVEEIKLTGEPWIGRNSGFTVIGLLSVAMCVFMAWQLFPTEGLLRSILWGLGFGAAIWVVFGLSLAFNTLVRGKRNPGKK